MSRTNRAQAGTSIVLKLGPTRRVDPGLGRPEAGTGPGWRKNGGRKNPVWPGGSTRWPGKTQWQTRWLLFFFVFFFFLLKRRRFDFFLKNWPGRPGQTRWPGQNPEPEPWTGPGLKTLGTSQFMRRHVTTWTNRSVLHNFQHSFTYDNIAIFFHVGIQHPSQI